MCGAATIAKGWSMNHRWGLLSFVAMLMVAAGTAIPDAEQLSMINAVMGVIEVNARE